MLCPGIKPTKSRSLVQHSTSWVNCPISQCLSRLATSLPLEFSSERRELFTPRSRWSSDEVARGRLLVPCHIYQTRTFLKVYVSSDFQTSRSQSWNTYKKLVITQTMSCLTYYFSKFEYRMKHFDSCLISDLLWIVILPGFCFFQGAKKLCPQCNMITSPSDLRRIYLWSVNNPYKSWILVQSGSHMVVVDAGIAQSALEDRIACDLQHDLILVKVLKGNCKPDSTPWTCLVCKFTFAAYR